MFQNSKTTRANFICLSKTKSDWVKRASSCKEAATTPRMKLRLQSLGSISKGLVTKAKVAESKTNPKYPSARFRAIAQKGCWQTQTKEYLKDSFELVFQKLELRKQRFRTRHPQKIAKTKTKSTILNSGSGKG